MNDFSYSGLLGAIAFGVIVVWILAHMLRAYLRTARMPQIPWGKVALAGGLVMVGLCWFFGNLLGLVAGGFVAVVGAVLFVKK